ncbi:thermonuclease family protein [Phycobacter sp. K97]|uniref:thermonuclease family protein n=1 Tax=Phycobacter sedimenti TaxID=3133977 RepID=UPI0031202B33
MKRIVKPSPTPIALRFFPMKIKSLFARLALTLAASAAISAELQPGDPISAKIFLQLHGIEKLAGQITPLVSGAGRDFRVIDGDSLAMGDYNIRLAEIDAPRTSQRCTTAQGSYWDCGAEARQRMRDLVMGAQSVECYSSKQDVYGRHLATCDADGIDVGALLVEEGLAWPHHNEGRYLPEASNAQAHSRGIWQAENTAPWELEDGQN